IRLRADRLHCRIAGSQSGGARAAQAVDRRQDASGRGGRVRSRRQLKLESEPQETSSPGGKGLPSRPPDVKTAGRRRGIVSRPSHRGGTMPVIVGRRKLIAAFGGAAAWPLAARAQKSAIPVVGYLNFGSSDASRLTGLRRGLNQTGYVEGRDFLIEYRGA